MSRRAWPRQRGLTLIEVVIAMAMLAVLATLALPSMGTMAERARLRAAAETMAADLSEARFEAARRGTPVMVDAAPGPGWCWAVATQSGCPCGTATACRLKASVQAAFTGIDLVSAQNAVLAADGTASGGGALFQAPHGDQLRVDLPTVGRARVCSPDARVPGYPACATVPAPAPP